GDATYACARSPVDGEIDWSASSVSIARLVRALGPPAPGALTFFRGEPLVIVEAREADAPLNYEGRIAGRVIDRDAASGAVEVVCGEGSLHIRRVRTSDGVEQAAAGVMRSVRESLGMNHTQEIVSL